MSIVLVFDLIRDSNNCTFHHQHSAISSPKMVVVKSILDSFSRCLGSQHQDPTNGSSSSNRPNGVNGSTSASPDAARLGLNIGEIEESGNASSACCELPLDYQGVALDSDQEREDGNFLAHARKKASAARRHRRLSKSSSTISRKANMEKARKKSNKRKLDIFRNVPQTSSSFSKLLGSNSAIPQMLCFANPIFDSADDDLKLYRDDFTVDEETIASTLYFDARYEHVVETRQPLPLYREFSVPCSETNDDIIQIYNNGTHQSIKSVYCSTKKPPPPPKNANTSMMDSSSSSENSSSFEQDCMITNNHEMLNAKEFNIAESPSTPTSTSCMEVPTPPMRMCQGRNETQAIESLDLFRGDDASPNLKLRSKSSNSTAALTYVCSSRSNASLSPGHGVRYKPHPTDHFLAAEKIRQPNDWVNMDDKNDFHVPRS